MDKSEQNEFESLLDINLNQLDVECIEQPRKVWIFGKKFAKAVRILDEAVAELKVAEADMDATIRESPADYGLEKITEAAIKRAILRSGEFQTAQEKVNEARYHLNMVEAANKALDHRRTCLTMLNSQDERNYFSHPAEPDTRTQKDMGKSKFRRPLKTEGKHD
jgi:hypothetical protein